MEGFKKYLVDLSVVILGITISLFIDDWQTNRNNAQTELRLLNGFKSDMLKDKATLENEIKSIDAYNSFLSKILNHRNVPVPKDSFDQFADRFMWYSFINISNLTFIEMEQSDLAYVISHKNLLNRLNTFYVLDYGKIREIMNIDKQLTIEKFIPYLDASYDVNDVDGFNTFKTNQQFQNLVNTNLNFKSELSALYKHQVHSLDSLVFYINTAINHQL